VYTIVKWKKIDIFSPLYFFPLAYILYLYIGSLDSLQDTATISDKQWIFYLIGLAAFYIGCSIPVIKTLIYKREWKKCERHWQRNRLLIVLLGIFSVAALARSITYLFSGVPLLSEDILFARLEASEGGYLGQIGMSTEVVFMVSLAALLLYKKNRFPFMALLFFTLVFSILTGTRTSLFRQCIPAIILYHYMVKKIPMRTVIAIVLIGLVFIGSISFLRLYKEWGTITLEEIQKENIKPAFFWLYFTARDFKHGPEGFARVLEMVPHKHPYQYGRMHILPFLFPLPGKQSAPGVILKEMAGLEFKGVGMAATILGAQYADFGLLGIILGMFFVGFLFEYFYLVAKRKKHHFYYLIYGVIFVTLALGIRTNYLNFEILWIIFLLTMIHLITGRKIPNEQHSP
jgi:oligosaccharide repeat unit polymerase